MGARVTVVFEGLDTVLNRLTEIEEKIPQNLVKQTAALAKDTEEEWKEVTPRKSGRLMEAEKVIPSGLSFTLNNNVYYYKFLDEGHLTPRGWRTRHGYRRAKRRTRVEARLMTERAMDFVTYNILKYLAKSFDNI